jgi:hypothetical protein
MGVNLTGSAGQLDGKTLPTWTTDAATEAAGALLDRLLAEPVRHHARPVSCTLHAEPCGGAEDAANPSFTPATYVDVAAEMDLLLPCPPPPPPPPPPLPGTASAAHASAR